MDFLINSLAIISIIYLIYSVWFYFHAKKINLQLKNQTEEEIEMVCTDEICINPNNWLVYKWSYSNYYLTHYFRKKYFFSYSENIFYRKLCDFFQKFTQKNKYIIFSKVRVSDVVWSPSWSKSWLTINPRHFDFVICDASDAFKPVMIIELDDPTHKDPKRKKIDRKKDEICEYIHLPLVRINGDFSDKVIKNELQEILNLENNE